jgi:hypothetical protein
MVDILSQKIVVGSRIFCYRSQRILLNQTDRKTASFAAIYSASAEDKAIELCFLEHQEITFVPRQNTYPDVLFLSS